MARLQESFLERIEAFCNRAVAVAEALEKKKLSRRIVDQVIGCGTSVGANIFEADEAMSTSDFVKCVCIAVKELNEFRFWLRLALSQGWLRQSQLEPLLQETIELKKILGTMISRSKKS